MELHGKNLIGGELSAEGQRSIVARNPATGKDLFPGFFEATSSEVDRAVRLAADAALPFSQCSPEKLAAFLIEIADQIQRLGDELLARASSESGLGLDRLTGERARTLNQIRLFAEIVRSGSWLQPFIDRALPDRKPLPRPDLRRTCIPIGPVVVFGASNFPLAFSVAGGDTVSALAAGNPVIVKGHPAHPGTSEMVATAIRKAVEASSLPDGVFSLVQGASPRVSIDLVTHPDLRAVGFTGSERAGRALFDAAARRANPIPVYAEMGSVNPVFLLPSAVADAERIARGVFGSFTLGVGQFCTKPGLVIGESGAAFEGLRGRLAELVRDAPAGTMLYGGIRDAFRQRVGEAAEVDGVTEVMAAVPAVVETSDKAEARAHLLSVDAGTWLENQELHEEIFGPATVAVGCDSRAQMTAVANALEGNLTATVHGTPEELEEYADMIAILRGKVGRIIFNGYPTGVEVSYAMHHGGPYPATTDAKYTSVGATAIYRFVRPVCYQDFPDASLPDELKNANPRGLWRVVDGRLTQEGW
ncbi:aldehyde dehydrogenase (NADP(+)) [Edaphobacter aggregans]|uniref:aldehyde dehydrogenase (NADP(+)) n=1 Tax=Edaphobacter aggregans TaxID=570835 RepID=UPI000551CDD9|nr:aldehyde dehydrogenase (NADP(+)) [Edaphobacter aggregans]